VRWSGGEIVIGGIAFAGSRGISKVEVSSDAATTWQDATLEAPAGPLAWRRWTFRWTPPGTGTHSLAVRSTDGLGNLETPIRRDPFPNGSTGYHQVQVSVAR
jgi:molybdenum-dependent oxidoreductase-like protein